MCNTLVNELNHKALYDYLECGTHKLPLKEIKLFMRVGNNSTHTTLHTYVVPLCSNIVEELNDAIDKRANLFSTQCKQKDATITYKVMEANFPLVYQFLLINKMMCNQIAEIDSATKYILLKNPITIETLSALEYFCIGASEEAASRVTQAVFQ